MNAQNPDPWTDTGYQRPDVDRAPAQPVTCPWCDHTGPHDINTGPLGGIICAACTNLFTGRPGEHDAMRHHRDMWTEETRPGDPPPPPT